LKPIFIARSAQKGCSFRKFFLTNALFSCTKIARGFLYFVGLNFGPIRSVNFCFVVLQKIVLPRGKPGKTRSSMSPAALVLVLFFFQSVARSRRDMKYFTQLVFEKNEIKSIVVYL